MRLLRQNAVYSEKRMAIFLEPHRQEDLIREKDKRLPRPKVYIIKL